MSLELYVWVNDRWLYMVSILKVVCFGNIFKVNEELKTKIGVGPRIQTGNT